MDKHYKIRGMTCQSCERCIENALLKIDGIISAKANYKTGLVIIDIEQQVDEKSMAEIIGSEIEKLGYSFLQSEENPTVSKKQTAILLLAIIALAVGAMFLQRTFGIGLDSLQAGSALGLGILFLIGLINSLHCAAMCGGINLSLCASYGQNRYSGKMCQS